MQAMVSEEDAEQAENPQQEGGDNSQRTVQGDPGQPCERVFDLNELLKELEREQLGSSIIERAFYPAPLTVPPREREAEWVAWSMLAWASPAGIAPFDEELASEGFYSKVFREHSDRGLAEIEAKKNPLLPSLLPSSNSNRWGSTTTRCFTARPRPPISLYK